MIAEGGQARLYVATDSELERKVAIKVYKDVGDRGSFWREVKSLVTIESPHIPRILDVVESSSKRSFAIVQEYVSGSPILQVYCAARNNRERQMLLLQLARGLSAIHATGLVHRDIRAENILVDTAGVLKILDFGISSADGEETYRRRGTEFFAAPEIYEELRGRRISTSADVYSFAVLALFLEGQGVIPHWIPSRGAPNKELGTTDAGVFGTAGVNLLRNCLEANQEARPRATDLVAFLELIVNRNLHRATIWHKGITPSEGILLSEASASVRLAANNGEVNVRYDGLKFSVDNPKGPVYMNNQCISSPVEMFDSCVITLGPPELRNKRIFVTVDLSWPEVIV